ncbi:hypothetical protein [Bradyrhizobium sp.]|uniref:hypothetical protein n=1 Tax=Bradyrhizobium sp. TaxID=376 RepID=UPI003C5A4B76
MRDGGDAEQDLREGIAECGKLLSRELDPAVAESLRCYRAELEARLRILQRGGLSGINEGWLRSKLARAMPGNDASAQAASFVSGPDLKTAVPISIARSPGHPSGS